MRRLFAIIAAAALFCAGGACGWLMRGGWGTGVSPVQPGEKPLATVTAKMGKTTGAITVSFASKKGDKAKYVVELVWRGDKFFAGHVTRTWKDDKVSYAAYGTAEVK